MWCCTLIEQNLFRKITLVKERNFRCWTLLIIELNTSLTSSRDAAAPFSCWIGSSFRSQGERDA
ncbi:hypothetical protein PVAP13_8KG244003 [Panicum virgatum]|uniref:Uncharacterized protein n=1 Tax=Panicum virgatum TaxID=38727 RepID=A0A8T0PK76_PANVG|nr:hypothetical protein PVAP13_8KG244003 [Panicum virgatum]